MVVEDLDTDLITPMVVTILGPHSGVADNPSHHRNHHYAHSHESYAAWGAGGGGAEFGYRGARGREGIVVVYEYYGD